MPKRNLSPHERAKLKRRIARAQREAERVRIITERRDTLDITYMMRDNRASGL